MSGSFVSRAPLLKLGLSGAAIVLTFLVREATVHLVVPRDLDLYNGEKIMRPSTGPSQAVEFIPNSANDSYIGVPVRTNSLGLRQPEVTVPIPAGIFRVLGLGDSVTFALVMARILPLWNAPKPGWIPEGLVGPDRRGWPRRLGDRPQRRHAACADDGEYGRPLRGAEAAQGSQPGAGAAGELREPSGRSRLLLWL